MKVFADKNSNFFMKMATEKVLKTDRKQYGKRRNCSLRAISPFPTVFSKDLYSKQVKITRACLGQGLTKCEHHVLPCGSINETYRDKRKRCQNAYINGW